MNARTHLIVGGFPPGASAGHGMDYARRWRGMWPCPYPGASWSRRDKDSR